MLKYIKNTIITVREAAGIDMYLLPDEKMVCFGVCLKSSRGKVVTTAHIEHVNNISELKRKIPEKVPVSMSINGNGVLMRSVPKNSGDNIIGSVLPGSNPNDFFYTVHQLNEDHHIAFIIRKTKVEEIIQLFQSSGIRLVSLTLGSEGIENILPFISRGKALINTPMLLLEISDQKLQDVTIQDHTGNKVYPEIKIGDMYYRTSQSLGLGNGLKVLHKPADRLGSEIRTTEINYLQKDYVYYKLFQFTKWTILVSTLALSLFNFFVFNHYFKKNRELVWQNNLTHIQQQQNTISSEKLDSSYSFFIKSGWNKNTRYGYYIDRIAALVPASLNFKNIEVAPVVESLSANDYLFSKNKIIITGVSNNPSELETFSRALRNIQGVENVLINNYSYKEDINAAVFNIELTIKS